MTDGRGFRLLWCVQHHEAEYTYWSSRMSIFPVSVRFESSGV
ncbi:hypothetical protein Ec53638_3363 [Escherichia coli 53638]|nr:hypothetical protein Ec53638_3363 [Escherichia coli 53638]EFZ58763.1 hypothetical protein ECLT68_2546 [Escherichia coli LT-68]EGI93187.1 hypothetical protein SB521682_2995 [Shigella boydii 5216-82]